MDKDERKSFFRFLNSASNAEIERKMMGLVLIASKLTDPVAIEQYQWMLSQMNLELDARREAGLYKADPVISGVE